MPKRAKPNSSASDQTLAVNAELHSQSNESAEFYGHVVARLNARWRVIECKDQIQWILQRRDAGRSHGARWRGQSYCLTRAVLIRLCGSLDEASDPNALRTLEALPDRFRKAGR